VCCVSLDVENTIRIRSESVFKSDFL